jgi:hypothetical protein
VEKGKAAIRLWVGSAVAIAAVRVVLQNSRLFIVVISAPSVVEVLKE